MFPAGFRKGKRQVGRCWDEGMMLPIFQGLAFPSFFSAPDNLSASSRSEERLMVFALMTLGPKPGITGNP